MAAGQITLKCGEREFCLGERTLLMGYRVGRKVNLEVDVIARYLERLLTAKEESQPAPQGVTLAQLAESGFLK